MKITFLFVKFYWVSLDSFHKFITIFYQSNLNFELLVEIRIWWYFNIRLITMCSEFSQIETLLIKFFVKVNRLN